MLSNKKILVISQHYWPEYFRVTDLCEGLVEMKIDVDVICGIPNYPMGKFYDGYSYFKNLRQVKNGVNIFRAIELPRSNNSNISIFLNYHSFPFFSLFMLIHFLFKKYDKILIYQTSPVLMGIIGILLGKTKNIEITI